MHRTLYVQWGQSVRGLKMDSCTYQDETNNAFDTRWAGEPCQVSRTFVMKRARPPDILARDVTISNIGDEPEKKNIASARVARIRELLNS